MITELLDDVLSSDPDIQSIRSWPRAEPLPRQIWIVGIATQQAGRVGAHLPDQLLVSWVLAPFEAFTGCAALRTDGSVLLTFNVNLAPNHLREVCFHELMHAHDFSTGGFRTLTRAQFERRAIAFACQMMARTEGV